MRFVTERRVTRFLGEPSTAWVALAAGVVAVCAHSASSYTIPVMMKSILAETGWGRGEFAATSVTRSAAVAVSGLLWGLCTDRYGARSVLVTGALVVAGGLLAFGAMRSLAELYLVGAVVGTGIGALGPIAASTLVARRFGPRRGIALGLLHGGDNLLNSAVPRATAALLLALGWRGAAWAIAGVYVLVAGALFLGLAPGAGRAEVREQPSRPGPRLRDLPWSRRELHLVALVFLAAYGFLGAVMFHFVPYQTDLDLPVEAASSTFGYLILAGFFGSFLVGLGAQRFSAVGMLGTVQVWIACCSTGLWMFDGGAALRVWAVLHGLAAAGYAPLTALVVAELFGARAPNLGGTIGLAFLLAMVGVYLGNVGAGWGHDVAQTYLPVWRVSTAVLTVSLVPLAVLVRSTRRTAGARGPS